MANIFDPQRFFEKTAYYASQGRGLFTFGSIPSGVAPRSGWGELARELLRRGVVAKTVSSPSSSLATFEEFSYNGPTRKHPHTQIFGPITVEFYLMGNQLEETQSLYHIFSLWHEYIAGPRFLSGEATNDVRSDSTYYAIEYYENYIAPDAEFTVYTPQNPVTPVICNKYYELYPINIGGIQTSWESPDAPLTLSVEFEFYYMQSQIDKK